MAEIRPYQAVSGPLKEGPLILREGPFRLTLGPRRLAEGLSSSKKALRPHSDATGHIQAELGPSQAGRWPLLD